MMEAVLNSCSVLAFLLLLGGCGKEPTEEQKRYLRGHVSSSESITIRLHSDLDAKPLVHIDSLKDVMQLRVEIELDRVHPSREKTGEYDLVFNSSAGDQFIVNYSAKENRIRFPNPWKIEGTPYGNFELILNRYLSSWESR